MPPKPNQLLLEVVKHEEYGEFELKYNKLGEVIKATPIEGSGTAFLHLRAPNGTVIRAQIPHNRLDSLLAMIYPDF